MPTRPGQVPDQLATVRKMMRILPDGFGDDQRSIRIDLGKDFHSFFLGGDEAVLFGFLEGMGADQLVPGGGEGGGEGFLHLCLGRPAFLVGGEAEVTVGY
jgi:hypothetical protein